MDEVLTSGRRISRRTRSIAEVGPGRSRGRDGVQRCPNGKRSDRVDRSRAGEDVPSRRLSRRPDGACSADGGRRGHRHGHGGSPGRNSADGAWNLPRHATLPTPSTARRCTPSSGPEYDPEFQVAGHALGGALAPAGGRFRSRRAGGQFAGHSPSVSDPLAARRDPLEYRTLRGSQRPLHRALTLDARHSAALHGMLACSTPAARLPMRSSLSSAIERDPEVLEYHHTRAYLLERFGHYGVAADELERYLRLLPEKGFKDQVKLAKARMKFQAFGDRTPLSMGDDVRTQVHVIPFREQRESHRTGPSSPRRARL